MRKNEFYKAIEERDLLKIQRILDSKPSFGWFEFGLNDAIKHVLEDQKKSIPHEIVKMLINSKADPNIPLKIKNNNDYWEMPGGDSGDLPPSRYFTYNTLEYAFLRHDVRNQLL